MATLTISAAARICHCDRRTLQRAIHAGRLHLDADHCLSREELIATSDLVVDTPQEAPQGMPQSMPQQTPYSTPRRTPQGTPQGTSHPTPQAGAALLPLLERLALAIEALRMEIQRLREYAPHGTPQEEPHGTLQGAPQASPQILGLYDPRAAAVRIRDLRRQGLSYTLIAVQLTREGIPTRYGKPWEHSSVRYVLETYGRDEGAPENEAAVWIGAAGGARAVCGSKPSRNDS
jgi:Recombinase